MNQDLNEAKKQEAQNFKKELRAKSFGYIFGALGLVAGLAWNDAIKATIDYIFPIDRSGLEAKFIYAAVVTLLVVILTFYISRFIDSSDDDSEK